MSHNKFVGGSLKVYFPKWVSYRFGWRMAPNLGIGHICKLGCLDGGGVLLLGWVINQGPQMACTLMLPKTNDITL